MIIVYLIIFGLLLWRVSYSKEAFQVDYLGREQTNAIKGISIALVFVSHISGYLWQVGYSFGTPMDIAYLSVQQAIGQLCVVMFLFYSGYGVGESIKAKRHNYVQSLPKKRILTTWLNYLVAVVAFIFVGFLLGERYSALQLFVTAFAWESIGQSNWYVFVILSCYIVTYLAYTLSARLQRNDYSDKIGLLLTIIWIFALFVMFKVVHRPGHWHSTILAYAAGLLISYYKDVWTVRVEKKYAYYLLGSIFLFLFLYAIHSLYGGHPIIGRICQCNFVGISMTIMVTLITMKIKVGNPVIAWMGSNLFPIYIYQRIPMKVFGSFGCRNGHSCAWVCAYVVLCVAFTGLFAYCYKYFKISFK